jgi:hypothetical protein
MQKHLLMQIEQRQRRHLTSPKTGMPLIVKGAIQRFVMISTAMPTTGCIIVATTLEIAPAE